MIFNLSLRGQIGKITDFAKVLGSYHLYFNWWIFDLCDLFTV